MRALVALLRLGIDFGDIALMQRDLLAAISRANNDLINSFSRS